MASQLFRRDDKFHSPVAPYDPKAALSVIAMLLYGALAGLLWFRYFKMTRPRPKWMRWLPVGTTMMCIGFAIRISRRNGTGAWSFLSETILLLTAPCAIIAQDYKLMSKLSLYLEADDCLLIRRSWLMPLFLTSDAITFLSQLAGTAMQATTIDNIMEYGTYVTLGGLIVQAVTLVTFVSSWFLFRRRIVSRSHHQDKWSNSSAWLVSGARRTDFRWTWICIGLSCLGCFIRALYRVVEYASGTDSYVTRHEAFFYIFDSIPLALSVGIFVFFWPPFALDNAVSELHTTRSDVMMTQQYGVGHTASY